MQIVGHQPLIEKKLTSYNMAVGQNPGTPVNIPKAFKKDYSGVETIPKKVPFFRHSA